MPNGGEGYPPISAKALAQHGMRNTKR